MSNTRQEQRQDGENSGTTQSGPNKGSTAPSPGTTGRVQLEQSLTGKGYDEQVALSRRTRRCR